MDSSKLRVTRSHVMATPSGKAFKLPLLFTQLTLRVFPGPGERWPSPSTTAADNGQRTSKALASLSGGVLVPLSHEYHFRFSEQMSVTVLSLWGSAPTFRSITGKWGLGSWSGPHSFSLPKACYATHKCCANTVRMGQREQNFATEAYGKPVVILGGPETPGSMKLLHPLWWRRVWGELMGFVFIAFYKDPGPFVIGGLIENGPLWK